MQRLRIRFRRGEEVKFISHLDLMRLWQRAMHRAAVPLAYSEGFSPHPRIALAAPLPVGVTRQSELMDVVLTRFVSPHAFVSALNGSLPPGIEVLQAFPVAETMPSLQSQVSLADYEVDIETDLHRTEGEAAVKKLLATKELLWQHQRDTGARSYDLRKLIDDIHLVDCHAGVCTLAMRLRCDSNGSGRPEQVAAALGFTGYPRAVRRQRLILKTG